MAEAASADRDDGGSLLEGLRVVGSKTLPPHPAILDALKQDYEIEASIADLVDNSIDAGARNVLIRFFREGDRLRALAIVDDGGGMDAATIDQAMEFARRRPYDTDSLGMFGIGLKTASLSQADTLTVLSRHARGEPVGRQWTTDGIKARAWQCNIIDPRSIAGHLKIEWGPIGQLETGTIVRWDDVREFNRIRYGADEYLQAVRTRIRHRLGLVLHRFLQRRKVSITIDVQDVATGEMGTSSTVTGLNPFPVRQALPGYPARFKARLPKLGTIALRGHIWPRRSKDDGYKLGGDVANMQGFYFFRHDRLIQPGGWNGFRSDGEPHFSLARVEVDIPDAYSDYLGVRSSKSGVDVAPSFIACLNDARTSSGQTLRAYVEEAERIYRTHGEHQAKPLVAPAEGVPAPVRAALEKTGARFHRGRGIRIAWRRLAGHVFFDVDRTENTLYLNSRHRRTLLRGERGGGADVPIVRTLLYFLLNSTFERERSSDLEEARLSAMNDALAAAMKLEAKRTDG